MGGIVCGIGLEGLSTATQPGFHQKNVDWVVKYRTHEYTIRSSCIDKSHAEAISEFIFQAAFGHRSIIARG